MYVPRIFRRAEFRNFPLGHVSIEMNTVIIQCIVRNEMVLKLLDLNEYSVLRATARGKIKLPSTRICQLLGGTEMGVELPQGIIELSGEPGSGKTQLWYDRNDTPHILLSAFKLPWRMRK
eukprot:Gregarina_sp_Poly_1__10103@NODE_686_length_6765_cov_78_516124_g517_i0_p6_GENE_NODE_686_length_6765_cov_78_516124_g517_i0NODE_686_length_6765_cov_78_516124_g517_i0_p6_ORF_typecomplete_len120_score11_90Rad51/PF08423_11/0_00047ATPase/PF06745_13/0_28_NODE_686_length_6765_cov_78_516124_g517_i029953354